MFLNYTLFFVDFLEQKILAKNLYSLTFQCEILSFLFGFRAKKKIAGADG